MPLQLPEPDQTRLPRSPLDLVVCQLRFETQPRVQDATFALAAREALGGEAEYPRFEQVQAHALNLMLGPGMPPAAGQASPVSGWRLQSADGMWVISLMPDHVALETTRYESWDQFRERMDALLAATAEQVSPGIEQRIGLRYIDRISEVDARSPADWQHYLAPELLGLVLHDSLGGNVTTARQQLLLDLGEGFACAFTHGFLPSSEEQQLDYLLDYDLFRDGGRLFDLDGVRAALDTLHVDALKLFQASVTETLIEALREPVAT